MIDLIKKFGPWFAAVALLFFLIGKYTATSSVTKELETKYSKITQEFEESSKTKYEQRISAITESMRVDYESKIAKITNTSKVTIIGKDGTTTITEQSKTKENIDTKNTSTSTSDKIDDKTTQVSQTDTKIDIKEVNKDMKEVSKISSTPLYRMYGSATISDNKELTFGAGVMYDLYFTNVGILGTYTPDTKRKAIGLTFGLNL